MNLAPRMCSPILVCLALALAGCAKSSWLYRYRSTIEVETPEGVRTGSNVVEVRDYFNTPFPFSLIEPKRGQLIERPRGEATAVDLSPLEFCSPCCWDEAWAGMST